jgi:hypothetical protein
VGQYVAAAEDDDDTLADNGAAAEADELGGGGAARVVDGTKITIGEALEATAFSAGDQPVEPSDAEAIAAAEARASGTGEAPPDGLAARARAAADANAAAWRDEDDRTTLRDVLAVRTPRTRPTFHPSRGSRRRVTATCSSCVHRTTCLALCAW